MGDVMSDEQVPSERPPVWVGHVSIKSRDVDATTTVLETIGLREIFLREGISIFELRGGTHIIVQQDDSHKPAEVHFDLMVENIDEAHKTYVTAGLDVGTIARGKIHDSFVLNEPGGNRFVVNSTHVPDHDAV
jgi:hypothetical protein